MKVLLISAYFKEEKRSIPTSYKLAEILCAAGEEVVVLTSKHISNPTYERHPNLKVYETKDIFIPDPLNLNVMPFLYRDLSKILKKEKPDVCIVSKYIFFTILAVPYLKLRHQKVIVVTDTHAGITQLFRSRFLQFLTKIYYYTVGYTMLNLANLVVLTHEELVPATKKLGIKNYRVIHNGINLSEFDKAKPSNISHKGINIAFVGRLASIKGLDTLLDAASRITAKHRDVRFLLVGEGKAPRKVPGVEVLGYRKDVPGILKKCDILVMPSISEGLPNAVMEGMAAGLPVVASDIPGGMNVLVKDNKTGLRFKKGDSTDLEQKLEQLIEHPSLRHRFGKRARNLIEQEFSSKMMSAQWIKTLEEVAC